MPDRKTDPAIYEYAVRTSNAGHPHPPLFRSNECLIEDSRAGIRSGLQAAMQVLAFAITYPADRLREAHVVFADPQGITSDPVERHFVSWEAWVGKGAWDCERRGTTENG